MSQSVIDFHIHVQPFHMLKPEVRETFWKGKSNRAELEAMATDPKRLLAHMDREGVERVGLINYVSPDVMGFTAECNDWMLAFAKEAPDRLLAFGSVHPAFTQTVGDDARRLVDKGIRAFKVHPPHQQFECNAYLGALPQLAELYAVAEESGLPVTIHTGTSIFPGARSRLGQPMDVDDVAVDFPKMTILLAHGGRPLWMDEAFFVVRRHPRVYLEISGIPPQRLLEWFPRLEEIAHKVIWGTDWPSPGVPSMRKNIDQFLALPLSAESKERILHGNAKEILAGRA
jgi:predicted TIM-barrel fold metal-dependent hydrolase